jgi:hypothetical protein
MSDGVLVVTIVALVVLGVVALVLGMQFQSKVRLTRGQFATAPERPATWEQARLCEAELTAIFPATGSWPSW